MTDVQLIDLCKDFGPRTVLQQLNLDVFDNEYLVLLGASGCGKTTLLRIIAGLDSPESGQIRLGGQDAQPIAPRHRDVSMVFQSDGLYPHLTAEENLRFVGKKRVPKRDLDSRIQHAIDLLDISSLLSRRPGQLSGGEQRRVAIAKSLVRGASVRLFDEPLSALDALIRHQLQNDLRHLHQNTPATTIHVTHDGDEAMRMADRIAVMHDGKILQVDTPENIYAHPGSLAVAQAIGTPPINCLKAIVKDEMVVFDNPQLPALRCRTKLEEGRRVIVAVRPESISVCDPNSNGWNTKATCTLSRTYSGKLYLQLKIGDDLLEGCVSAKSSINEGSELQISLVENEIHFFDDVT